MASGTINIPKSGWTALETLHSETYGNLTGMRNPNLGIAFLRWGGNGTTPPSSTDLQTWDLPTGYTPAANASVVMRNGNQMEVTQGSTVRMTFTATTWSGCCILYPTA